MTTIAPASVICGNCGAQVAITVVTSTYQRGAPDLDLRPPSLVRETLRFQINSCSLCGYCGDDLTVWSESDRRILESDEYSKIRAGRLPELAKSFACSALIRERRADFLSAAHDWLRAAWACDDAGDDSQAREMRERSLEILRRAIETGLPEEGPTEVDLKLLKIDLLRRSGQFDRAEALCAELCAQDLDSYLRMIVEYQVSLITERDSASHTLPTQ